MHKAAQIVFNYGSYKRKLCKYESFEYKERVTQIYVLYFQFLKQVVKIAFPKRTMYIAIDGVAPLAKQIQQRQRRFKAKTDSEFDSNNLSAGTLFMHDLTKYINYHIRREIQYGEWRGVEVIFSPHTSPGEGEHTCLDYIRSLNGDETVCMYGPDGDLLMLGLVTPRQFYLLKEDLYVCEQWYCIDTTAIRKELIKNMGLVKAYTRKEDDDIIERGVADFILMGFFLGNDFLPKIEMFYLLEDGLDMFLKTYKLIMAPSKKFLVNCDMTINRENFHFFLENIQREETKYLTMQNDVVCDVKFENKTLQECISAANDVKFLNFDKYHGLYYERKLENVNPSQVVSSYLDGMKWILHYYMQGCPSVDWVYKYHYPPFVIDIINHLFEWKEPVFIMTAPHTPFEQLISILPPSSFNLLPKPYKKLLFKEELHDFFSTDIEIDYEGKKEEYNGIVLTPMIDFNIIKKHYLSIILYKSYDRNTPTVDKKMTYDSNISYKYISQYGTINNCHIKVIDINDK